MTSDHAARQNMKVSALGEPDVFKVGSFNIHEGILRGGSKKSPALADRKQGPETDPIRRNCCQCGCISRREPAGGEDVMRCLKVQPAGGGCEAPRLPTVLCLSVICFAPGRCYWLQWVGNPQWLEWVVSLWTWTMINTRRSGRRAHKCGFISTSLASSQGPRFLLHKDRHISLAAAR